MPPSPQILEPTGEKYALIVGVDNFRDGRIPALRYAKNDALALRDLLTHEEFGKFQRENVHVLLDEEATLGDIRSQFVYWLAAKVQENDQVWIYFSGRGTTTALEAARNEHSFTNYFITHDANPEDLPFSAMALQQLKEWLDLLTAGRIVLIFDCGFSGFGKGRSWASGKLPAYEDYTFFNDAMNDERCLALVAAGPMETAGEDDEAELGLFTRILLHRLRLVMATNQEQDTTWEQLQQYLTAEVARQAELRGGAQTPVRFGGLPEMPSMDGEIPAHYSKPPELAQVSAQERAQRLLREAQQELHADNLNYARELLLEILDIDPGNHRALSGLQKLDELLQKGDREGQIKQAFDEARRYFDERNYVEATRWYGKVLELDPLSESARVGVEACQTFLQKPVAEPLAEPNGTMTETRAVWEKQVHTPKMKEYDQFIWPYVGWWALVGAVWGLFGTQTEDPSTATTFITVVKYGFFGGLIGVVHASAVYFYKLVELRIKAKKLRKIT